MKSIIQEHQNGQWTIEEEVASSFSKIAVVKNKHEKVISAIENSTMLGWPNQQLNKLIEISGDEYIVHLPYVWDKRNAKICMHKLERMK